MARASATKQHSTARGTAAIPTWFGIGGGAAEVASPASINELADLLREYPDAVILGEGANLLVDDAGVDRLVITLDSPGFKQTAIDARTGRVHAKAGVDLRKLITDTVRAGLGGLERLSGIPATIGGATIMNAGGTCGELCEFITRVHTLDRAGTERTIERQDIAFGYRTSGLAGQIITAVDLQLTPKSDAAELRERMKSILAAKGASQPMGSKSAGCVFKNPTLAHSLPELGLGAGERASAGMLIDRAGGKGVRVGDAVVSDRHANFITTGPAATARDVIELIERVRTIVLDRFGVSLEREVVIWPTDLRGSGAAGGAQER